MISLSRLDGQQIVVNADLIELLEAKPDTIITLVDGTNYVVAESLQEVVSKVRMFKASVLVNCNGLDRRIQLRPSPRGR